MIDADRALIARHAAALRRLGVPAQETLALIAGKLPQHVELRALQGALARGEGAALAGADPLLVLLARGEAASPQALDDAVRGFELSIESERAVRSGFLLLVSTLGLATLLMLGETTLSSDVLGQLTGVFFKEGSGPAVTVVMIFLARVFSVLGLIAFTGALVFRAQVGRRLPGVGETRTAAQLRLLAAAMEGGILPLRDGAEQMEKLGLDRYERLLARQLSARQGPLRAAQLLAAELEGEGLARARNFVGGTPVAMYVLLVIAVIVLVGGTLTPIFVVAGAVR